MIEGSEFVFRYDQKFYVLQTGSWVPEASYTMDTGGSFFEDKVGAARN
jgi:hypothetical protein